MNTTYTVTEGERWDTIAYKAYGDVNRLPEIIAANPGVPITERLEAGTVLNIPVISDPDTDTELLPPWKR
jgi:phage tail protein X